MGDPTERAMTRPWLVHSLVWLLAVAGLIAIVTMIW
jgi:hypothetical protein